MFRGGGGGLGGGGKLRNVKPYGQQLMDFVHLAILFKKKTEFR